MSERYDALVIGAGLGGLAAAARLARAGLRVRCFERHVQPGGYATTFVRGRFEFEVSLHALSGIGRPGRRGTLWPILEELGITERVRFLPLQPLYRSVAPGMDLRVPPDAEGAIDALGRAFPAERDGFRSLIDRFLAVRDEALDATKAGRGEPGVVEALARYPRLAHAATVPLGAVLDRELHDPLAKLALCQLWGYFGLPPSRLSLLYFAVGLASYLRDGAAYPEGKSQSLSNALAEAAETAGGVLTLGRGVRRILVEGGRAVGVETDRGERFEADVVIANVSPLSACVDLIGRERVPEPYLRRIGAAPASLSSVCVYLGLAADRRTFGLDDHEVFVNDSADIESHYRACLGTGRPEAFLLSCYDATDPRFSPAGTSTVVLVALADGAAWTRVAPDDYRAAKERIAESLLERAERLYPGLRERIETLSISTPITNMRYTGNPLGAIYGFANTPAQNPAWRPEHRGPLEGLWFCGAWTRPGGGYEPCIESGWQAAGAVLREHRTRGRR
jgi:prolycopene isomerase